MLVSVDPGIRGAGLAVFGEDKRLLLATYVKNPCKGGNQAAEVRALVYEIETEFVARFGDTHRVKRVAVEWPQNYAAGQQKGDQNDLLPLSAVSACVGVLFPRAEVTSYIPRAWKSTMPDFVCAGRVLNELSPAEAAVFDEIEKLALAVAKCRETGKDLKATGIKSHNTADAVGIGLKALGRFEPNRVIPV